MEQEIQELLDFIQTSTSPYHTVLSSSKWLDKAGFQELDMKTPWQLEANKGYYVKVFDSTLLAFVAGKKEGPLRLAAAHTDFPCFRLKPQADMVVGGYGMLNVERYGGLILRSWLDRPLSLAGKVALRTADAFAPEIRLVDFQRPLITIPSLAIHMDRAVNDKGALNPQKDMLPVAEAFSENGAIDEEFFLSWLAKELGVVQKDILSYELSTYPVEAGCAVGLHEEMLSSPRLDNLTSVKACLDGIRAVDKENVKGVRLIALFDNEEVGSQTKQGAGSAILRQVLERIYEALGKSHEQLLADIAAGFMLSVDVAHALHPNYKEKCDPKLQPIMGRGLALKQAASQSYAGDTEAVAIVRGLCEANDIPWQQFVNRSDMRGGSTLGSIASALVPIRTMDIGVPILAMHSARELMGKEDMLSIAKLLRVFMQ